MRISTTPKQTGRGGRTRERAPLVLSVTALAVAVLGATPTGHAVGERVAAAVPAFAKTAGYAKLAGNSAKLNGRKSTLSGAPGTIPVVGKDGKLPASIGAVGPQGQPGPAGAKGDTGASGATKVVVRTLSMQTAGLGGGESRCNAGEVATGGGFRTTYKAVVTESRPVTSGGQTPTGWRAIIFSPSSVEPLDVFAVCASP